MGPFRSVVTAAKVFVGFGVGFVLIVAGLLFVSRFGGDPISLALGNELLFVSFGGKLLSILLGGAGIGVGTGFVRWAEDNRRAAVGGPLEGDADDHPRSEGTVR